MTLLPRKLKKDALVETLFEVRFASADIPEAVIGRLLGELPKLFDNGAVIDRLPAADIPAPIRKMDPGFAFQPIMQVRDQPGQRIARFGDSVASWHSIASYPGWEEFRKELNKFNSILVDVLGTSAVHRMGLRYLNFLQAEEHKISGIHDLTIDVTIGQTVLDAPLNVQFQRVKDNYSLAVRLASPEYAQAGRTDFSLLLDLDVFSEDSSRLSLATAMDWAEPAHSLIKEQFFALLKDHVLQFLVEE